MDDEFAGECKDLEGLRVVLPARVWHEKVLSDHPEMDAHINDVLRAVSKPDHVAIDPVYDERRRYYLRNAGPSRWLLAVVSYEQEPPRIVSAFGNRKDPRSWNR